MLVHRWLGSLPYPLNEVHTATDVCITGDTLAYLHILLEQSLGLASVLATAASVPDGATEQDLLNSLAVLKGYIETTLAVFVRWRDVG